MVCQKVTAAFLVPHVLLAGELKFYMKLIHFLPATPGTTRMMDSRYHSEIKSGGGPFQLFPLCTEISLRLGGDICT